MFIDFEPVGEGGATESAAERFEVGFGLRAAKCESRKSFQNISTRCNNLYVQTIFRGVCTWAQIWIMHYPWSWWNT